MRRQQIREAVFNIVFQSEFHEEDGHDTMIELALDIDGASKKEKAQIDEKAKKIISMKDELDEIINQASNSWKTSRMPKADLTILRIGTYEIEEEGLEVAIAINEAVQMAKKYGTDKSYSFVNGVLGSIANK